MAFTNQLNFLVRLALLSVGLTLLLASQSESRPLDQELSMVERHKHWMAQHGRIYKDATEKAERFKIFQNNVNRIEAFNNMKRYKFTLSVNKFSDLTEEEFRAIYSTGYHNMPHSNSSAASMPPATSKPEFVNDAPAEMDWRKKGAVTDVKYQQKCGCCWAFSAVAAIEGLNQIKTTHLVSLSEQELVDCVTDARGCNGGWMDSAFEFVQQNQGIATESSYPYTAVDGNTCRAQEFSSAVQISSFQDVTPNDESELLQAVAQQPVSIALDASSFYFQHYEKGVFDMECGNSLTHAVALIGYGTGEDGTKYWILKNSWSTSWGEEGYMRIERDAAVEGGRCGLAMRPSYPTA